MRIHGVPFTYTKAYGVQSEISHVTVTRVAGQEVNYHRNVNTYHRDMMCKINSLCREQKRLKEYRRKLLKRKRKSYDLGNKNAVNMTYVQNGNHLTRNKMDKKERKTFEDQEENQTNDVQPKFVSKNGSEETVLLAAGNDEILDLRNEQTETNGTKIESIQKNEKDMEVVLLERVDEKEVASLCSERYGNEAPVGSYSRLSCEVKLEFSRRGSEKFTSTPKAAPPIRPLRDIGLIPDKTDERKLFLSPGKKTNLKPELKVPQQDFISTNLIKLQCASNYKLLCRLVDAIAHRQNDKDLLSNKQKMANSEGLFKTSKPAFDHQKLKGGRIEKPNLNTPSLFCTCENNAERQNDAIVSSCRCHSPWTVEEVNLTREGMTGKRVLPPISVKGSKNSVRHDINRYLRSVSPVDPLLKRLSNFEKVNQVTWKTAFSSLKSLKCL